VPLFGKGEGDDGDSRSDYHRQVCKYVLTRREFCLWIKSLQRNCQFN